jgi:hypothetical protein
MPNMNILWAELPCHRLRYSPKSKFRRCKRRETLPTSQARSRSGKQDCSTPSFKHISRGFSPNEETCEAGELPCLEEQLFRGLQQGLLCIGTAIEQTDVDGPDTLLYMREKVFDLRFLAGVNTKGVCAQSVGVQLVNEMLRLAGRSSRDAYSVASRGKSARNGGTNCVAGGDQKSYSCNVSHLEIHALGRCVFVPRGRTNNR